MQMKGSFCFYLSWFSPGNKFILPHIVPKQSPEKEAEDAKDNRFCYYKILPGLKWLKWEMFFRFPHCHRFRQVYPGKNPSERGGIKGLPTTQLRGPLIPSYFFEENHVNYSQSIWELPSWAPSKTLTSFLPCQPPTSWGFCGGTLRQQMCMFWGKLNRPHTLRYPASLLKRSSPFPTLLVIHFLKLFIGLFVLEERTQKIILLWLFSSGPINYFQ